ncbi:MAG: endonuclease domain-containing protein, partial [Patescibacteria group bacterium]
MTTKLYNRKDSESIRRNLRNNQTSSEKILWNKIRRNQVNGYHFRRQYGFGKYVVDFYCRDLRLVIEVDGANHFFNEKSTKYDIQRQKFIESLKIRFLRFTTTDIYHNLNGVMETIYEATFLPPPNLPLMKGEEEEKEPYFSSP